jgi:3-oxoadipate enol-lactonase
MVERLVLADTTSGYPEPGKIAWTERIAAVRAGGMQAVVDGTLARWMTEAFRERRPETVAQIRQMILATPPEGFIGCGSAIRDYEVWDRIAAIGCPTLVLVGEHDAATTPTVAQRIAETIPGAGLTVLPDAAHLSCIEQPEAFDRALAGFLGIR